MSYTKEKWKLSFNNNWKTNPFSIIVQGKYGVHATTVANIPTRMTIPPQEQKANAQLIAAAPDLLKALEGIMQTVAGCQKESHWEVARAAINKARGTE